MRYITFKGERLNITQWSKKLGLDRKTVYSRLYDGVPMTEALSATPRFSPARFWLGDEYLTIAQLAKRSGIGPECLRKRLKKGMTALEAISTPVKVQNQWVDAPDELSRERIPGLRLSFSTP